MPVMERVIQRIQKNRMQEASELEKEWSALLKRCGFPSRRWYRAHYGSEDNRVVVWECEWEDMATMEAAYTKVYDPEIRTLATELMSRSVYESSRRELYVVLPWGENNEE